MKHIVTRLPLIVLTIVGLSFGSRSQSEEKPLKTPLTVEEQESELTRLCEVFASVDKLPAKGARWVEIQTGSTEHGVWHKGWLLREAEADIELLGEGGWKNTFDKKKLTTTRPASEFTWSDVRAVRDGDFAQFCGDFLAAKKETQDDSEEIGVDRFEQEFAAADAAVVDASRLACWANATGREDLARTLLQRAADKLQQRRATYLGVACEATLHQFVAGRISPHTEGKSSPDTSTVGLDPRESRLCSLEWNQALAGIPYRSDHDAILRRIKQLESLIAEDKAWKEPAEDEFAKMDVKQKAAYWLYHLRDLNVRQSSSPGMCMVLTDLSWSLVQSQDLAKVGTPNSAVELKKLGYDALPQIIQHLDDDRPTRCIGFWRHYAPDSYYTLTYGDCCQQIFEAMALHSIYERTNTNGYPIRDGLGKQCQQRAKKWWEDFQKKGEKQVLMEASMRGDRDSYLNAERLAKRFPEAAFEPLRDGIRATKESWIRSNLLNVMRGLNDDRIIPFLREQTQGPYLYARVNATEGLLERGHEEAVALLVAEWMKLDLDTVNRYEMDGPKRLQAALARCGNAKAISALAAKWKEMPLDWRHSSLETLQHVDKDLAKKPFTPAARTAVEDLLISCLGDCEEDDRRRRTCDLAANALAVRWSDPGLLDSSAPLSVRNRRIVQVQNVWRKKQGLSLLPVPETRTVQPVADAALLPLLTTLIESSSAEGQRHASEAVERLGLGALPRVRRELASLPKDHPAHERLSRLACRLACIVDDIRFSSDSVSRPDNMLRAAESLKNRPLSEKAFVELLIAVHTLLPTESRGMVIALDRDGDDTGIQLEIRVLPRRDPLEGSSVHLRRREQVVVDGQELLNSMSATVGIGQETRSEWNSSDWKSLVTFLQQALESPPEKQLQVRAEVTRGR